MPAATTTVHHLYRRIGDLLPACGTIPGPERPEWHTGHDADALVRMAECGAGCCVLCLELARTCI